MRAVTATIGFMLAGMPGLQLAWAICSKDCESQQADHPGETLAILRQNAIGLWLLGALFCFAAINVYRWMA